VSQRYARNLFLNGEAILTRVDHPGVVELQVADDRMGEAGYPWRFAVLEFEAESAPASKIENSECQSEFLNSEKKLAGRQFTGGLAPDFPAVAPRGQGSSTQTGRRRELSGRIARKVSGRNLL
jgi:hypothetical protein